MSEKKEQTMLKTYYFDNVVFKRSKDKTDSPVEFTLEKVFSRDITKIDENEFEYTLRCDFHDTDGQKLPYQFVAEIIGQFHIPNWESKSTMYELEAMCASTLFPILRAYAATVTINSNIQPLILGLINLNDWLEIIDSGRET